MTIDALLLAAGNLALVLAAAVGAGWPLYNRLRQVPPSTYAEMEQTLADMNRQMSELRQQQAADHNEMRRLRAEITRIDAALQEWSEQFLALAREFREATGREPNTRPPGALAPVAPSPATPLSPSALVRLNTSPFDPAPVGGLSLLQGPARNRSGARA